MQKCLLPIETKDKPAQIVEQTKWDDMCNQAAYFIKRSLSEDMAMRVADVDHPFDIYKILRETFEGVGMDKGIKLVGKLNQINANFPGLASVIPAISQIKNEFTKHFDFTKDDFWVAYVLHSLPPKSDQLRVALKTKDKLTLDNLKTFFNQEAMREETATIANLNSNDSSKKFCLVCGKKNHTTERCFNRKKESVTFDDNQIKRQGQNRYKDKKNTQPTKNENKPINANLVARQKCQVNCLNNKPNLWFIDSGATHHVVTSQNIIQNGVQRPDITLESASGSDIGAAGFGQVCIKARSKTINLSDVILAPKLQANFLSVSRLIKANLEVRFFKQNGIGTATVT